MAGAADRAAYRPAVLMRSVHTGCSRQCGMALMLVLWVLAVLTIMGGAFALSTRRALEQTQYEQVAAQSVALADGGVHYAMFMLTHPDPMQRWRSDGTVYPLRLPAGDLRIQIHDEGARMDINAMQEPTLRAFFASVFGDDALAARLTDTVLDWRDPDSLRRMQGAEIEDYRAAGRMPGPQNRPFLMPEELAGVLGMTPDIFLRLESLITVWSGQDGIDPTKASAEMLRVLFRGDEKMVAQVLAARSANLDGRGPGLTIPPVPGFNFVTATNAAYRVSVDTSINGEPGLGVEAVVRTGGVVAGKPFAIASWKVLTAASGVPPTPRDALGYR